MITVCLCVCVCFNFECVSSISSFYLIRLIIFANFCTRESEFLCPFLTQNEYFVCHNDVGEKRDEHSKYPSELYKDSKIKDYVEPD